MKFNHKLLAIPILVLISLVYISFLFSSEIQRLKYQIDNIYFGNFIPVHKLHIIKEEYKNIIYNSKNFKSNKKNIIENWNSYSKQYKTSKEKQTIEKIDQQLKNSLKKYDKRFYTYMIEQIELLIKHEVYSASLQRKNFLKEYKRISKYLFYNQIFIIIFIIIFISYIIFITIKNNSKLEFLIEKYKLDSITDGLTGLYNRKHFDMVFSNMMPISKENNWTSAFVMIDIDFFKQYNDTYGHESGDVALQKVSKTLNLTFKKEYDYLFRLGGEEFGILIFDTNIRKVKENLNLLQKNILKQNIIHKASKTNLLTISMGVVIIDKKTYDYSSKELYKLADGKLYDSKDNGRDRYTI